MTTSLSMWFFYYGLKSLLFAWILFWGGAEFLERSGLWGLWGNWTSDTIKLWTGFLWILSTIWFLLGLIKPEYRLM